MFRVARLAAALSAAITYLLTTSATFAHHAGGVGNAQGAGPVNTISASTLEEGHGVAGFAVDYTSFDTLSNATLLDAAAAGIEDVHGLDTIQSFGLSFSYGVSNDLMLTVRLPYVRRTGIREVPHEHEEGEIHVEHADEPAEVEDLGSTEGVGDLSLLGQYRFLNDHATRAEAALLLGLKTPTGKTDERHGDEVLEAEFQPGSGSWDALFGLALTHRVGPWSFDSNVLYSLVTEGTQHVDLGDLFLYNTAVSYRLSSLGAPTPMFHGGHSHEAGDDGHAHAHSHHAEAAEHGPVLDLVLELNGEWHGKQEAAGIKDENSGGNTIYVSPGLRLSIDQWSGFFSVGIPVVKDLNGIQVEPDWRISTGASLAF